MKWKTRIKKTKNQENRNRESTDFVCYNTHLKAYFVEQIANKAWLDNYRKKPDEDVKGGTILSYVGMELSRFQHGIPMKKIYFHCVIEIRYV